MTSTCETDGTKLNGSNQNDRVLYVPLVGRQECLLFREGVWLEGQKPMEAEWDSQYWWYTGWKNAGQGRCPPAMWASEMMPPRS